MEGTGPVALPVFEVEVLVDVVGEEEVVPLDVVLVEGPELDDVEVDGPVDPDVDVVGELLVVVTPPEVLVVGAEVVVVFPERAA
ncbi:MAG: hypothetical protein ACHQ1H_06175 [Nitrososphaerales archaeon]